MFWRFNYMPSRVDSLLDKENVTLEELMDEDDIVQECKSQNKKLIDFLVQPQIMETMVNMIVGAPCETADEKSRYKYSNVACDLITSDVTEITESIATSEMLLNTIYTFLESESDLNPLQASFFSKVMGLLITRKSQLTIAFLKSRENFIDQLLHHLGVSAIMDVLLRLITCIESTECRNECITWLNDERLVTRLIALINPQHPAEKHTNAAQSLCDIIRLSREQMTSTIQDTMSTGSDALLKSIETPETVSSLLDHMLNGEHVESVIINGLYVIQTLLECRKVSPDGLQEPLSVMDLQQLSPGAASTISAIVVRLKDFHQLLLNPPKQHYMPMPTSVGIMQVPLGQTRLQIVRLISMLIMTNLESVNGELASLGTLSVLLDLFFQYSWNNFLHAYVEQCVSAVLSYSQNNSVLQTQLLSEFHLLERIAEAFEANQALQSQPGQQRRGYMGHLTRIANQLAGSTVVVDTPRDGERRHINSLFEGLPDPVREQWNDCVCGHLADINKLNTVELVGGSSGLTSSSDDDDDFRSISFPQDDALQKAFSEYQQQKMTSDFVEQFGFNEEEFAEHEECIGSPFNERVSSISFELSTVEDSPSAAAMFEHACSDRIRQFDSTDSDEELWEDKELSFSRSSDNRHSSVNQQRSTGANPGVATMTAADHRTAAAAAGAMRNVDSDEDDVDDDYDDEQDEVLNSGENSGDDSDPELTSPRIIRQQPADEASGMPEGDQSSSPKEDGSDVSLKIGGATGEQSTDNDVQQQQTETIDVGSPNDSQVSALCLDKLSDISDKVQDSVELSEDIVEVDQVSIDVLSGSSIDHDNIQTPVDLLTRNNDVNKLESVRMPCLVDACGGSDSVSYSAIANGPI